MEFKAQIYDTIKDIIITDSVIMNYHLKIETQASPPILFILNYVIWTQTTLGSSFKPPQKKYCGAVVNSIGPILVTIYDILEFGSGKHQVPVVFTKKLEFADLVMKAFFILNRISFPIFLFFIF